MISVGQIVFSKAGNDKGIPFIVINIEGDYVYIVDGERRKLSAPKKKKVKHIQITNNIDQSIQEKLMSNSYILDADFRKALMSYRGVCKEAL